MKILVATAKTQGDRRNDFFHTIHGEPVYLGMVCDACRVNPDGGCGCARAFLGLTSNKGTTTARVAWVNNTWREYTATVLAGLARHLNQPPDSGGLRMIAAAHAAGVANATEALPVGTVVGRHLHHTYLRAEPPGIARTAPDTHWLGDACPGGHTDDDTPLSRTVRTARGRIITWRRQLGRCSHCVCGPSCDAIGCGEVCRATNCQACIGGCPDQHQDPGCQGKA